MIAALPMYDRPRNRGAHQAFWSLVRDGLRAAGIAAPHTLDHSLPYNATWARSDLVLGQICNLPYRTTYRDSLTVIGASDYGLDGCAPGFYRSLFIMHRDDPRSGAAVFAGGRIVANAIDSQSGYGVLHQYAARTGIRLPHVSFTGSHDASVQAVATGHADFAAIDAQTWTMMQHDTAAVRLCRIVGRSWTGPGQTFVTRSPQDPAIFRAVLNDAVGALSGPTRRLLGLRAVVPLPPAAYDAPLSRTPSFA